MALFAVYSRTGEEKKGPPPRPRPILLVYHSEISTFMQHTFTEPLTQSSSWLETVEVANTDFDLEFTRTFWEGANEANQKTAFRRKSIGATGREYKTRKF